MGCLIDYDERTEHYHDNQNSQIWTHGNSYNGDNHPSLISDRANPRRNNYRDISSYTQEGKISEYTET